MGRLIDLRVKYNTPLKKTLSLDFKEELMETCFSIIAFEDPKGGNGIRERVPKQSKTAKMKMTEEVCKI